MNHKLPTFSNIDIKQIPSELKTRLNNNREKIGELLKNSRFTWGNLIAPLEELNVALQQYWSKINHLNAVVNTPELRAVYNQCLPLLSDYYTELSHNHSLYVAIQSIANSDSFSKLDQAQQKIIHNELRDFKLAGVSLKPEKKKQFAALVKALDQQQTRFEENLLDATHQWSKLIKDENQLSGIPDSTREQARQQAKEKGQSGWLLTLEMPCYLAVMMNADSRALRESLYRAYVTRASENSEFKQFDNHSTLQEILEKRLALSQLLGFENHAQRSLVTKMADSPEKVLDFLSELADQSYEKARQEYQTLQAFAREHHQQNDLQAWDVTYFSEKLKKHHFDVSQEELRPYFPEENVINGLFTIVNHLFQLHIKPIDADVWHPDVRCYGAYDHNNTPISYFYLDLYARPQKRGGAWMDECRIRRKLADGSIQLPIAFITCNFNGPTNGKPALFTHDEVITLFHEFGHALQHMLTTVDYADVSGINGIPWDAVELPSQFLENWAWQRESLNLFARHYQTDEMLPEDLFQKLFAARNFQSAMQMVRQLEFSLFDMQLHIEFDPQQNNHVQSILNSVRRRVAVVPTPAFNRFQNGFSHIFAGGYAAGYYSYKWAEVMACDAFSLFMEKGIFDQESATKFRKYILEPGGSEEPAVLYRQYRGRDPEVSALLKQTGIIA